MKMRALWIGAALAIALAAITSQVASQDTKATGQPPEMSAEQAEMMQKWMEFMTPGEAHKVLDSKVGKWEAAIKMWETPDAPPSEMSGKSEVKWIFDGRYLVEDVEGSFMGMPFIGHGIAGYDNLKKKYCWVWIDNMGTGIMRAEGNYDPATKTFTFMYEYPDVMSGTYKKGRSVEKTIDKDHFLSESYATGPDGKEFKMMEMLYTRVQ